MRVKVGLGVRVRVMEVMACAHWSATKALSAIATILNLPMVSSSSSSPQTHSPAAMPSPLAAASPTLEEQLGSLVLLGHRTRRQGLGLGEDRQVRGGRAVGPRVGEPHA